MSVIYRYPLQLEDRQTLTIPEGGYVLSVQAYNKDNAPLSSWWLIPDPEAKTEEIVIRIIGTGMTFDDPIDTLVPYATVITYMPHVLTPMVWHVFEECVDV